MSRAAVVVLAAVVACAGACMGMGDHRRGADVLVDRAADGTTVSLRTGETLAVELGSLTDGGFDPWVLATAPDPAVLRLTLAVHRPPAQNLPGASGSDLFEFDAVGAGTTQLIATATRSFSGETATFQLRVLVRSLLVR